MKTYLKYILLFLTLTILLIVSCSEEAPVTLTSTPIAHAGADQLVEIFDIVYLDGSLSTNSENVEYIWTINDKPPGSITVLSDSSASDPILSPDLPGFYTVQLVVKNKGIYSEPDFVVIQAIDADTENYFPQKVGNKWKYKVTDSTGTVKDTITVEVVGTTTLKNGKQASIWVYSSFSWSSYPPIDTLYLVTSGDTLVYYWRYYQNDFLSIFPYIIPFQVGNGWRGGFWSAWWGDGVVVEGWIGEFTVLEFNPISVDIGTFPGAYKFYHTSGDAGFEGGGWNAYDWVVPRVGLVKMDVRRRLGTGGGIIYRDWEYWELVWYNLVE